MTSFDRKIRRKHGVALRKAYGKTMKQFRNQVKCIECDRMPAVGETIDNWQINKGSERIELICEKCHDEKQKLELQEDV